METVPSYVGIDPCFTLETIATKLLLDGSTAHGLTFVTILVLLWNESGIKFDVDPSIVLELILVLLFIDPNFFLALKPAVVGINIRFLVSMSVLIWTRYKFYFGSYPILRWTLCLFRFGIDPGLLLEVTMVLSFVSILVFR